MLHSEIVKTKHKQSPLYVLMYYGMLTPEYTYTLSCVYLGQMLWLNLAAFSPCLYSLDFLL